MIKWINMLLNRNQPTLEQNAESEAIGLDRDILNKELEMITMKHRIAEYRERQNHLQQWLKRRIKPYDPTMDGM